MIKTGLRIFAGLLLILHVSFAQKSNKLRGGHHDVINPRLTPGDYVNTYIGFRSSNTQITAQMPWGMASMGPNFVPRFTKDSTNLKIHGYGSMHLSGVGCGQFQTGITFIPTTGDLKYSIADNSSTFSKEITKPGYYKSKLDKFGIVSEMTATERTGIIRMIFPEGKANLIIDLGQKLSGSPSHWSSIVKISDTELEGYMSETAFCANESGHEVYFVLKLNKKIQQLEFYNKGQAQKQTNNELWSDKVAMGLIFNLNKTDTLEASIGLSYTSIINARVNLDTEQKDKKFADIRKQAFNSWNAELSKMTVEGGAENDKTMFYTGLYHALFHPNIISDVNGYYPAMNSRDIRKSDFTRYSTYSLWDTYRNLHPFLALVYPERQLDMVRSMVGMYKEGGWFPKWEHASRETNNMNGDPAIPVITDTYLKGLKDFDTQAAFEGMKKQSLNTSMGFKLRPGIDKYLQYGYIPNDDKGLHYVWGSVATTLEYTFADWSIARMAEAMGKKEDANEYYRRANFYKNVFDKETGFMRPRLKNGKFYDPFDPATTCGEQGPDVCWAGGVGFVEGNAWQYTFMVPHDQPGLIKLMGGEKEYINKLQQLFDNNQYRMSNEPDIANPFLFNYVKGEEWRTQKTVRDVLHSNFNNTPDGLSGDDDCGTMSVWVVLAMSGFYPDCPGSNRYALFSPVFKKVTIKLDPKFYPGKEFVIDTEHNAPGNVFINSMQMNDIKYESYFLKHEDIIKGGTLKMELGHEH